MSLIHALVYLEIIGITIFVFIYKNNAFYRECNGEHRIYFNASISMLTATLITLGLSGMLYFQIYSDTDAVINRAQIAADRDDMLEYMFTLKNNFEKHKITKGYFALIFRTPDTDLSLHLKAINKIIARLEKLKTIDNNSNTYQVAMSDIRGVIRELPNPSNGVFTVKYWYFFIINLIFFGLSIFFYSKV